MDRVLELLQAAFPIALVVAVFVAVRRIAREAALRIDLVWARAARKLMLGFDPSCSSLRSRRLFGHREGVQVEVQATRGKGPRTLFRVVGGFPADLAVRGEGAWTSVQKVFSGEDVRVGDIVFDCKVNIRGAEDQVVALMDAETRRLLADLVALGGRIEQRRIELERPGELEDEAELVRTVRGLIHLAGRLSRGETDKLLLDNATGHPEPSVRCRNLEVLARRSPGSGSASLAIAVGLKDPAPQVRLRAAILERGPAGASTLAALVKEEGAPGALRAAALEHLVGREAPREAKAAIGPALRSADPALQRAGVTAAGLLRDHSQLRRICGLAARAEDEALGEAIATALRKLGDGKAEPALLQLLGKEPVRVRIAAAEALGQVGSIRAVEPLLALSRGSVADGGLGDAARDAVRRIQGRLGDADAGRLSMALASSGGGALSLAAQGGEVSLPSPPAPASAASGEGKQEREDEAKAQAGPPARLRGG